MPITESQRKNRRNHIGASDVAAIMGCSPWATAADIWYEKTGRLEDAPPSDAMIAGTFLEKGILDWASTQLGKLKRNQYRSDPGLHLGCHLDAILQDTNEPVEAKLTGGYADGWGVPGTDEVPDHVILQAHAQMMALRSGPEVCHIAQLKAAKLSLYLVPHSADLSDVIAEALLKFWQCVISDTPPDSSGGLDVVKRLIRKEGKAVEIAPDVMSEWVVAKDRAAQARKAEDEAKAKLLEAMGDAEEGVLPGICAATYRKQTSRRVDTKKLKNDGMFDDYSKESTFRVLRYKEEAKNGNNGTGGAVGVEAAANQEHSDASR